MGFMTPRARVGGSDCEIKNAQNHNKHSAGHLATD